MKIIRIIVYEGTQERVEAQLAQSMSDGRRSGLFTKDTHAVTISIATIPGRFTLLRFLRTVWGLL